MKKIILMFVAMIIATASFAQKGDQTPAQQTGAVIDTLAAKGSKIIDAGKKAIAYVDTSSNFKSMYSDVKQGVIAIANGMHQSAELVFMALVKKQVAYSFAYLFNIIMMFVFLYLSYINFGKVEYEELINSNRQEEGQKKRAVTYETERFHSFGIAFAAIAAVCLLITLFTIKSMFMGFVAPEAGAIEEVVDMVSKLKNGQ